MKRNKVSIEFRNIWRLVDVTRLDWTDAKDLVNWTELVSKEDWANDNIQIQMNFNMLSFVHNLGGEQKESLLRTLAANIGFDKARTYIDDQEEFEELESKSGGWNILLEDANV